MERKTVITLNLSTDNQLVIEFRPEVCEQGTAAGRTWSGCRQEEIHDRTHFPSDRSKGAGSDQCRHGRTGR